MRGFFRSTAVRIALAFALALTATTYIVFALVYWRFYADNVSLVESVLRDEVEQTRDAPIDRLRRQLELRLTQDLRHLDYVGLYDKAGTLMFGNVAASIAIPIDGRPHLVRTPPPLQEAWQSENAILVARRRTDGGTLVLGRSLVYVDQLQAAMLRAFAAAIIPVILLALAIGSVVSLRASRRLSMIQRAIERVMRGDLLVRLPARGTPDDVDELVRAVNLMLDEIGRLVGQIRSVGDNIAHDLRTPLAVMRARLERGLASASEATLRATTAEALRDLERAMTTVTALLRISELESGLRRGSFSRVDLVAVCRDAYELYEPLGQAKGLRMRFEAPAPVVVTGDADLLREAVANLVDNAIKFTPNDGTVSLECGGAGSLIRVRDSGPGVATGEREMIVKRFYRSPRTCAAAGVGLGLSMATTIVELHGFGLRIRDNDPGALFEIVADPQQPSRPPTDGDRLAEIRPSLPGLPGKGLRRNLMEALVRKT